MEEKELWNIFQSMTLEEKLGQMTQTTGELFIGKEFSDELVVTGPPVEDLGFTDKNLYMVGSVLGVSSSQAINAVQKVYLEKSRLKIPLMFMHDAIHGYRTIFPIPLALASTFDKSIVKKVGEMTAQELRSVGIHANFSPMVDLVRDARWGRVMESFGEDPKLSGTLGESMIEGYQGSTDGTILENNVIACLKHFAAYGAPDGGRDYASVDMSNREFLGYYARPYELALRATPRMVMASFNSLNGEPVTASHFLLENILRQKYGFADMIISDWGAVPELIKHGVAENSKIAGNLAIKAGIEIEMVSNTFLNHGMEYVKNAPELASKIDQAVWNFLNLKNELGLFENPYIDEAQEKSVIRSNQMIESARAISEDSCVLLKNESGTLPLTTDEAILIIGPFAKTQELLGNWNCKGQQSETVSLEMGFNNYTNNIYAFEYLDEVPEQILTSARKVLVTVGESWDKSGEGHSSVNLELDLEQQSLIYDLKALGKIVIGIGFSGRPLALESIINELDALLWTWYLGNEAGNAIARLVLGFNTPTGRLPMSFPRVTGQTPLSYNEFRSGRPANKSTYSSRYQDLEIGPLYPFGYGLRYGEIKISHLRTSSGIITDNKPLKLQFELSNDSDYDTKETVVLYMEDVVSNLVRPQRELIDYQRVVLNKGETKTVEFIVRTTELAYVDNKGNKKLENGKVNFYINDLNKVVASVEVQNILDDKVKYQ